MKDLHILPKFRDVWSYLYVEHCRIDQGGKAIAIRDARGRVPIPCANLALLMLGPGTSITHAAISALADSGCLVFWCGEEGLRLYAYGQGKTRNADNLMHQARLWASSSLRLQVVMRLYEMRFDEPLEGTLSLPQIRGKEGIRIREAYGRASRETGVPWRSRSYKRESWPEADPVNRALSTANSCLNGICQAAILALGLSPALGFIHTGKMLSFVYDIADLYKTKVSIPLAFRIVATSTERLERRVRKACREIFRGDRLLKKIVYDIHDVLELKPKTGKNSFFNFDADQSLPGPLWGQDSVSGGRNYCHEIIKEG